MSRPEARITDAGARALRLPPRAAGRGARFVILCISALIPLLVIGLPLTPARAAGTVTDCSNDTDLNAKLAGGGLVTFNCPLPATIVMTGTGGNDGFVPESNTTIDGTNRGRPVTLSGDGSTRLFHHVAAHGTLTLMHLTMRDGNAGSAYGGCLYNDGGTVVLVDVTVTGCQTTSNGGALNSNNGVLKLVDSRVTNNKGLFGGGIYSVGTLTLFNSLVSDNEAAGFPSVSGAGGLYIFGSAVISNSRILDNSAQQNGGGVYIDSGTTSLFTVTLSGNTADGLGGGIYIASASSSLEKVTLDGNSAGSGGGLYNNYVAGLTNVTVSGNEASGSGGGIYNALQLGLKNVTVADNSAASGGGMFTAGGANVSSTLTNTVVAYSTGGDCGGKAIASSQYSLASDGSCSLAGSGDQNGVDPLLTALGYYGGPSTSSGHAMRVHMLKAGSPAINLVPAGADAPPDDQRGVARPQDGLSDSGAVERRSTDSSLAPRAYLPLIER